MSVSLWDDKKKELAKRPEKDAIDCDEKYDPEKDTGKASLRAQCAKGLTSLGELRGRTVGVSFLVFSCVGLDRSWFL